MVELHRITTEYVEVEDRIRLACEADGAGDAPVVMWLTQRLLQRLLPVLLQGLQGQGCDTGYGGLLQDFAQQAAQAEWRPAPPVQPGERSAAWLVLSVEIAQSAEAVRMTFRGDQGLHASVALAPTQLRQWLGMAHAAYAKAGWPMQLWPQWVRDSSPPVVRPAVVLH